MDNQEKMKVMSDFQKYLISRDISQIEGYSLVELRHADAAFGNLDINGGYRIALRNRIKDLESELDLIRQNNSQRYLILISFVIGVATAVIAQWIIKQLNLA